MKKSILTIVAVLALSISLAFAGSVEARTISVHSYYKPSTHTYVQSYHRTTPNYTRLDNFSTKGNYNPYTGKKGYVKPYKF